MPVLLMEKDPFVDSLETPDIAFQEANVRRPLLGMLPKQQRMAFLSVYRASSSGGTKHVSLMDSSAPAAGGTGEGYSSANHNFIVRGVNHQFQEKAQVVETFGPFYVFFYGEKPQFLQVQGLLLNARDFNWKNEWIRNYNRYLRGTKCVENRSRVYMGFDDVLINGYIMNTNVNYDANNPLVCPFSFTMLVTGYKDLSEGSSEYRHAYDPTKDSSDGLIPTYLSGISSDSYNYVDMATGTLVSQSGESINVPASNPSERTASWTGDGRVMKLSRDPSDALTEIDTELAVQQTEGSDRTTARRDLRAGASTFPLASRSSSSASIAAALSSGVANGAFEIDSHPKVG